MAEPAGFPSDAPPASAAAPGAAPGKVLSPAAARAIAEAQERRRLADEAALQQARSGEDGGPKGPEPTRFGDWERKGLAIDF